MAEVFVGIGSNQEREYHTRAAKHELERHFEHVRVSRVFECSAVGFNGPAFYNWVAQFSTSHSIEAVVQCFKQIERDYGRPDNLKKFTGRGLDLDLLLYDDEIRAGAIPLPRQDVTDCAYVLRPLAELAPQRRHPVNQQTYQELWSDFGDNSQQVVPIDFRW